MTRRLQKRLSKRAVAEALDVSTDTVERRAAAGLLPPGIRDGGRRYWTEADVARYQRRLLRK